MALKIGHDIDTLKKLAFVKEKLSQYYDSIVMYEQIIELEPNEIYFDVVQNLYDKGYTQEYILNKFGVSSISDINDISVKNWFEGKNEKNVFIIKESKTFFSKQYSQLDINKIPTCK